MKNGFYDVCIAGGLGRVGLPLGISLAHSGRKVVLYDINRKAASTVSEARMPFVESGAEEILKKVLGKNLFISTDKKIVSKARFLIVAIGTPVDEHLNPKFDVFRKFFDGIKGLIQNGQHVILRSTVFPGMTERIKERLEAEGISPKVSFCPERIAQGRAMEELRELPQIIASFDEAAFNEAKELFSSLTGEIIFLKPAEAELAKLFTNIWRYIQFAISNQFYQIATEQGLDFYRIYDAVKYKYPRAGSFAPAGLTAGPCLLKDTMQLASHSNNTFFLGHAAMLVNEGLPNFLVRQLGLKYPLGNKTVGILGMAFKAESDDKRESLSYKLKNILETEAKKVLCSDVYIKDGSVPADELVRDSDIIILAAPHKQYAGLVIDEHKVLVDVWNFYGRGGGIHS